MAKAYLLIRSYESGDWDAVSELAESIGVQAADVGNAYLESVRWVAEASGLGGDN